MKSSVLESFNNYIQSIRERELVYWLLAVAVAVEGVSSLLSASTKVVKEMAEFLGMSLACSEFMH
jgi:predicted nuclease of restriction endonuclease-like RecB superfamily